MAFLLVMGSDSDSSSESDERKPTSTPTKQCKAGTVSEAAPAKDAISPDVRDIKLETSASISGSPPSIDVSALRAPLPSSLAAATQFELGELHPAAALAEERSHTHRLSDAAKQADVASNERK